MRLEGWFTAALAAMLLYGFWGFFPKLAVRYVSPASALIWEIAGAVVVGAITLVLVGFRPDAHPRGILFAGLTGITGMIGTLLFFHAAREGKIAVVVSMTALYPLVTILLAAIFLKEPITLKQVAGVVCALAAIFLFAA